MQTRGRAGAFPCELRLFNVFRMLPAGVVTDEQPVRNRASDSGPLLPVSGRAFAVRLKLTGFARAMPDAALGTNARSSGVLARACLASGPVPHERVRHLARMPEGAAGKMPWE